MPAKGAKKRSGHFLGRVSKRGEENGASRRTIYRKSNGKSGASLRAEARLCVTNTGKGFFLPWCRNYGIYKHFTHHLLYLVLFDRNHRLKVAQTQLVAA